jgi:outer membrane lipoprotein carrier protein
VRLFPSFLLALSLGLLCAAQQHPAGTPPDAAATSPALRSMESRYGAAHTLRVKFLERYTENGQFVRAESGIAYFLRPGKMRWDYQAPENNTFLVDGKYVWFYSPADRAATRMPAKQSDDWRTPLAFLTSHTKLSHLCAKIEAQSAGVAVQPGDLMFRCELKQAAGDPQTGVLFEVSPAGELKRIVVQEEGAQQLEFSFKDWEWNPPLDKSAFDFVPPSGVAIVEGLLPETSGMRQ